MPDETTGFEPEPFNLAALAGQEQLQERIRELENERAGKVLVDPDDLRAVLTPYVSGAPSSAEACKRLAAVAWPRSGAVTDEAQSGPGAANSLGRVSQDPGGRTDALSATEHQP
jgi:hypothetical protein